MCCQCGRKESPQSKLPPGRPWDFLDRVISITLTRMCLEMSPLLALTAVSGIAISPLIASFTRSWAIVARPVLLKASVDVVNILVARNCKNA